MKTLAPLLIICFVVASGIAAFFFVSGEDEPLRSTGVIVANEVIVAAEIGGRIRDLSVSEGSWVAKNEVIAVLDSDELEAEKRRQREVINQLSAKLNQARERVSLERARTPSELAGAEAKLRLARSQRDEAIAEWDQFKKDAERTWGLVKEGLLSRQEGEQRETSLRVVEARIRSLTDQITAAQAEHELARANERQVRIAMQEVEQNRAQLAQADADLAKLAARLEYTVVRAPLKGMISLRVARQGEVVNAGDPIVTIMDLDDVWVRAELEESYINRIVVGQPIAVRVPSGAEITGEVIFISPEAGFATQRDVSRVKRDIRTFGIKVALPNADRRLHAGMTAYVMLPDEVALSAGNLRDYEGGPRARDDRFEKTVYQLERVVNALERLVADTDDAPRTLQGDYPSSPSESLDDPPFGAEEESIDNYENELPPQREGEDEGGDEDLDRLINSLQTLIADYERSKSMPPEVAPLSESVASAAIAVQTEPSEPSPAPVEPEHPYHPVGQNNDPTEVVEYIQQLLRRSDTESLTALGLGESAPGWEEGLPAEPSPTQERPFSPPRETPSADEPSGEETATDPDDSQVARGMPEDDWSPLPNLVLQATAVIGEIPVALVNNEHIFEGDLYEEARVVKINDGAVEFEYAGRRFTVHF